MAVREYFPLKPYSLDTVAPRRGGNASWDALIKLHSHFPCLVVAASDAPDWVKDGADLVCDGTADEVEINVAIAALPDVGGKVALTGGVFNTAAPIHFTKSAVWLVGQGASKAYYDGAWRGGGSTVRLAAGSNCDMVDTNSAIRGYLHVSDIRFDGNNENDNGAANQSAGNGLHLAMFKSRLERVIAVDCWGNGIQTYDETGDEGDNWMYGCRADDNGLSGFRLDSVDCLGNNCMARQNGMRAAADNFLITSGANKLYGCKTGIGSRYGIYVVNTLDVVIEGSTIDSPALHGIVCVGSDGDTYGSTFIIGNLVRLPNQDDGAGDGIRVTAGALGTIGYRIMGNIVTTAGSGAGQPRYGVSIGADVEDAEVSGNHIGTCATAGVFDEGTNSKVHHNHGHVTENKGMGSITSGGTTDIITHGLGVTPAAEDISITLKENPTNTPGAIWVDTIGATYFTVNCENDPGASNLDFGWRAVVL